MGWKENYWFYNRFNGLKSISKCNLLYEWFEGVYFFNLKTMAKSYKDLEVYNITTQREVKWLGK